MNKLSSLLPKNKRGFTLIELMMVVAIITVLAAVAIPLVSKYLRKSKVAETSFNLRKIYDGEVSYFSEEHSDTSGNLLSKNFIAFAPLPATPGVDKQTVDWEGNGWSIIKFSSDSPVQYCYSVDASGVDLSASFTARAVGDQDGDGITSLFERVAKVDVSTGAVEGGAAVFSLDDLE